MLENKYSVFVCTKNIKVEIAASNFDGEAISKLSNYVIEVVDNLIGTSKCWFTVLNAKVLMDEVCSLVVRKFEINSNNANEKHKKFKNISYIQVSFVMLLCKISQRSRNVLFFEPEIEDFSVALYNTYIVELFKDNLEYP
ncbi:hypothetical protein HZS_5424 [Henneguya salminicola]|nr:hypothetical protein HZS_5424 [Henneguya salminicola]